MDPILTALYWLVAILTLGFIALFILKVVNDMKDGVMRFGKRLIRTKN